MPDPQRCTFCGRPTWIGTIHPCCQIEQAWGRKDCEACMIAEVRAQKKAGTFRQDWMRERT